jgi:GTP-binding protein
MWSQFISDYIHQSKGLAMVGLLIDMRHPGLPIDLKAFQWLSEIVPNLQIIGTKQDKLKKSETARQLKLLDHYFHCGHHAVASSAQSGAGKDDLLELIKERISE